MNEELDADWAEETIGSDNDDAVPSRGYRMLPTVGLGGSAGSVPALQSLLRALPTDLGMAFIVVVHPSPSQDESLEQALQPCTGMPVVMVQAGHVVEADHVYVVPPGHALRLTRSGIELRQLMQERGQRASVDLFFRSLAEAYGPHAIGVVLSGTDADGSIGIKRVKERGGLTIAQDPDEAVVASMPRAAIATGMIDWVLPMADIPRRLAEFRRLEQQLKLPAEEGPVPGDTPRDGDPSSESALREVLTHLRTRTNRDFVLYKRATIVRRIARRMQVTGVHDLQGYLQVLRTHPGEPGALLQDLLISVTNFFRDKHCFEALAAHIPGLFRGKGVNDRVRAWIAGCATGEEAYSIAMLLHEHAATLDAPPLIQVFATDLDEQAIQFARHGYYPSSIEADVSPERLRRFFVREHSGYRIRRELRETVLFAVHDLLKDSPFSRLDFVSCRNVLIYLTREAQTRVLQTFHFSLRAEGLLFLAASELVEDGSALFAVLDKRHRLYTQRPHSRAGVPMPTGPSTLALWSRTQPPSGGPPVPGRTFDSAAVETVRPAARPYPNGGSWSELHYRLLEQLAPPSLIVSAMHEVVHLSQSAGRFLQVSGGEPTKDLLRLIHPSLRLELRTTLLRAFNSGQPVESAPLRVDLGGSEVREVVMRASPVAEGAPGYLLVVFDSTAAPGEAPAPDAGGAAQEPVDPLIDQLDEEVERVKRQLRETVEQYEASNEELKASNEELQAMNEELRSATEELETGREELQSINEELSAVNNELKVKVEELGSANSDMLNLMYATAIPTVFLDRELRVTRYTPAAVEVFNLIPTDIGRPLTDLRNELDYPTLGADATKVLQRLIPIEREISRGGERWYLARLLPYRTSEDRIAGIVLTLVDLTEQRQTLKALRSSDERLRLIVENAREYAIFSLDLQRVVTSWNSGAQRLLGYTEAEAIGQSGDMIFTPEDIAAHAPAHEAETALATGRAADDRFHVRKDGSRFFASGIMSPMHDASGEIVGLVKILRDQSEARRHHEALERSRAELLSAWQEADRARSDAELQKEHLAALFTQAPAPICILRGSAHVVEFANPPMCQLWNLGAEDVIGKPIFDVVPGVRTAVMKDLLDKVLTSGAPHIGKEVRARLDVSGDGRLEDIYLNFTYAPLRGLSGEIEGVLVMAADVTDEVRAREQMSELHEMEQAASRAKDDFLAMLGHELRNPLAPMRTSLYLIRQRAGGNAPDPLFEVIERQAGNLARIVDDLLEAARITEGKIELRLETIDIASSVRQALAASREFLSTQRHQVEVALPDESLVVRADVVRMEQIVLNLLNNAGKYTPPGGKIRIAVQRVDDAVEVRIADNGIGISDELRPRLFQLFQQGERNLSRQEGGLGIGLSVVRRLVELHGGSVKALSAGPGQGSEFVVRLPLSEADATPPDRPSSQVQPDAPAAPPAEAARRVLVVDDNRDAGETLTILVQSLGHEARLAHDGPAALEACAAWSPDLVFLDIGLPLMDGYEVAREIQQRMKDKTPPLVAVTGYGQDRDRARTRAAGFDEHLVKPAEFQAIADILRRLQKPSTDAS